MKLEAVREMQFCFRKVDLSLEVGGEKALISKLVKGHGC